MSKKKRPSPSEERARAPREQAEQRPRQTATEDECCALLRGDPIAGPLQRRRPEHENREGKQS